MQAEPVLVDTTHKSIESGERALLRGWGVVVVLMIGYIGVYLCRKNLSVAVPLLQRDFAATKEQVGMIASVGTFAYAIGKFVNGPIVDRIGGRTGFLISLGAVAVFGAAGALVPSLGMLALFYGLNRYAGAAGWNAMVKIVPSWFGVARTATVLAVMSLSYVLGGVAAVLFARQVVAAGGGWRWVMGLPSIALLMLLVLCFLLVRKGPFSVPALSVKLGSGVRELLRKREFRIVCGISFVVTLMRESFNVWSVDFLTEAQGPGGSVAAAALHSIGFDLAGAVAIMANGLLWDRLPEGRRGLLLAGNLALLAIVLVFLPTVTRQSLVFGAILIGAVGLLVYGPFSLLSGVIAIETGGANSAATAAGFIDGVGYVAAILAGATLGRILDVGGYSLGFRVLAAAAALATLLSLGLSRRSPAVNV